MQKIFSSQLSCKKTSQKTQHRATKHRALTTESFQPNQISSTIFRSPIPRATAHQSPETGRSRQSIIQRRTIQRWPRALLTTAETSPAEEGEERRSPLRFLTGGIHPPVRPAPSPLLWPPRVNRGRVRLGISSGPSGSALAFLRRRLWLRRACRQIPPVRFLILLLLLLLFLPPFRSGFSFLLFSAYFCRINLRLVRRIL